MCFTDHGIDQLSLFQPESEETIQTLYCIKPTQQAQQAFFAKPIEPLPGSLNLSPTYAELSPDEIEADHFQPRHDFSQSKLAKLVKSIGMVGLIQPIAVAKTGGKYKLVAGERRLRAITVGRNLFPQNPHFQKVRCLIFRELPLDVKAIMQMDENVNRVDLTDFEEARGIMQIGMVKAREQGNSMMPDWEAAASLTNVQLTKRQEKLIGLR